MHWCHLINVVRSLHVVGKHLHVIHSFFVLNVRHHYHMFFSKHHEAKMRHLTFSTLGRKFAWKNLQFLIIFNEFGLK